MNLNEEMLNVKQHFQRELLSVKNDNQNLRYQLKDAVLEKKR